MEPEPVLTQVEAAPFLPVMTFNLEMDPPPDRFQIMGASQYFIAGNPYACPGIFKIAVTVG